MKQNKKQIEAALRNKMAAQYTAKIEVLQNKINCLSESNTKLYKKNWELSNENRILKDKVAQYEDWNRRLQEFMDMNEEDRKQYIENLRKSKELDKLLEKFGFYDNLLSRIFN